MEPDIVKVKIKRLHPGFDDIELPGYATHGSAGMDIRAALNGDFVLKAGAIDLIPTNIIVEIPQGFELQVRPRSGLAAKNGIGLLNS
ncbi:MAG TPA: dUTP diphosphatase, partial [Ignavibacteriaceae bacterium]